MAQQAVDGSKPGAVLCLCRIAAYCSSSSSPSIINTAPHHVTRSAGARLESSPFQLSGDKAGRTGRAAFSRVVCVLGGRLRLGHGQRGTSCPDLGMSQSSGLHNRYVHSMGYA